MFLLRKDRAATVRFVRRVAGVLGLVLAVAQLVAASASAVASSGEITQAEALPTLTHGDFAWSLNWNECSPEICEWRAVLMVEPVALEPSCLPSRSVENDPSVRVIWESGWLATNGAVALERTNQPLPGGTLTLRACLFVTYLQLAPHPACIAHSPNPELCLLEEWMRKRTLASKPLTVRPVTPPATTAPPATRATDSQDCQSALAAHRRAGQSLQRARYRLQRATLKAEKRRIRRTTARHRAAIRKAKLRVQQACG